MGLMARRPPIADRLREQAARVTDAEPAEIAAVLDEGAAEIELLRAQLVGMGVLVPGSTQNVLGPTEDHPDP